MTSERGPQDQEWDINEDEFHSNLSLNYYLLFSILNLLLFMDHSMSDFGSNLDLISLKHDIVKNILISWIQQSP